MWIRHGWFIEVQLLLVGQHTEFRVNLQAARSRFPHIINIPLFTELKGHVTPFALKYVLDQYHLLRNGVLPQCTGVFRATMGLPCTHEIQSRLYEVPAFLHLQDIHCHWYFLPQLVISAASIPPQILTQDPTIARPRGRPVRQPRRQPLRSTRRDLSHFEVTTTTTARRGRPRVPRHTTTL